MIDAATLAALPPDTMITITVRVGDLIRATQAINGGPEVMSTVQAARWIGKTPKFWRVEAEAGRIDGARKEGDRWLLPKAACKKRLTLSQSQTPGGKGGKRGPYRKAAPTQANGAGAEALSPRPLVRSGP